MVSLCVLNTHFEEYDTYRNWMSYYKLKYPEYYKFICPKTTDNESNDIKLIKEILLTIHRISQVPMNINYRIVLQLDAEEGFNNFEKNNLFIYWSVQIYICKFNDLYN